MAPCACHDTNVLAYLVGPLVRDYTARFRGFIWNFELSMDDMEAGLADDSLDIAIAFTPVRNADIECIPAFTEVLGIMVGREHPLYDSTLRLTADDIAQMDFALLAPDFITRLSVDEYFRQHGITPKVRIEVNSVSTLLEVVRHSPIATMLPEAIATEDRALRRLRVKAKRRSAGRRCCGARIIITVLRRRLSPTLSSKHILPVGAAEGCDLLILFLKTKVKRSSDRGPSLRQLLQGIVKKGLLPLGSRPFFNVEVVA